MLIMIETTSRSGISPLSAYRSLPPSGNLCLFGHFVLVCFKNLGTFPYYSDFTVMWTTDINTFLYLLKDDKGPYTDIGSEIIL